MGGFVNNLRRIGGAFFPPPNTVRTPPFIQPGTSTAPGMRPPIPGIPPQMGGVQDDDGSPTPDPMPMPPPQVQPQSPPPPTPQAPPPQAQTIKPPPPISQPDETENATPQVQAPQMATPPSAPPPMNAPPQMQQRSAPPAWGDQAAKAEQARQELQAVQRPIAPETKGVRKYVGAFLQGGLPGLASEAIRPGAAYAQQKYGVDLENAKNKYAVAERGLQDSLTEAQRGSQLENVNNLKDDRLEKRRQSAIDQQFKIAGAGVTEAQDHAPVDSSQAPTFTEFNDGTGKHLHMPTAAEKERQKRQADDEVKKADWVEVTPAMEKKYGDLGFKSGTKVDPARITQLIGFEDRNQRSTEANDLRRELATQHNETIRALAATRAGSSQGNEDDLQSMAEDVRDGKMDLRQVPAKSRGALATYMRKSGIDMPAPVSPGAAKIIQNVDPVLEQIQRLKESMEPLKGNNMPGYFLKDRVKYAVGMSSGTAGDIADLSMSGIVGAARILKGTSQAKEIFEKAQEHVPSVWKDSPQMIYEKLNKMEQSLKAGREAAIREGNKYGVRAGGSGPTAVRGSTTPGPTQQASGSVRVVSPDGTTGMMPASNLAEAIKRGFKLAKQ